MNNSKGRGTWLGKLVKGEMKVVKDEDGVTGVERS